jgi:hypothetical protein
LGIDSSLWHGGQNGGVVYIIYPGSGNWRPRELEEILDKSKQLFEVWSGLEKRNACLKSNRRDKAFIN